MIKPDRKLAQTQQKFKDFYDKNLRTKYEKLEPMRCKYLKKFHIRFLVSVFITAAIFLLCCCGIISSEVYESEGFIKFCALIIVVMIYFCSTPFADYCVETKSLVMDKILSFWGDFEYSNVSTIEVDEINKSELFSSFNREDTDDSFGGTYKNTKIRVAEKDLRVKGNKSDYSIFKGILICLKFNKKFKGKTVVHSKGNLFAKLRQNLLVMNILLILVIGFCFFANIFFLAEDFFEVILFTGLALFFFLMVYLGFKYFFKRRRQATQNVTLEEIQFSRKWRVLTDNQIEARYILTPKFMEQINQIKHFFHGKYIDFSFFDNSLMIAVHTRKDMFETTSLFTPALQYHKVREVVSQLHGIFSVIDTLNQKS